jgi:hypothetical protein
VTLRSLPSKRNKKKNTTEWNGREKENPEIQKRSLTNQIKMGDFSSLFLPLLTKKFDREKKKKST